MEEGSSKACRLFLAQRFTDSLQGFIFAQTLGGFIGAAIVYANYFHAIDIFEGSGIRTMKTAGVFGAYAVNFLPLPTTNRVLIPKLRRPSI
jgi:glycerol uptake facilitator-like aquaporin